MNLTLTAPWIAIIMIAANSIVYRLLNHRVPKWYPAAPWDDKISLTPVWIYPYISYYIFVAYTFVLFGKEIMGVEFIISYALGTLIAVVLWYLFPTGVKRPTLTLPDKVSTWLLKHFYIHDGDANAIPSGHVLHTFICAYYLCIHFPTSTPAVLISSTMIIISTVMVKQHYLADVISGLIVGIVSVLVGNRIA